MTSYQRSGNQSNGRHAGASAMFTVPREGPLWPRKDLSQIKYIIGTGGALTRLPERINIMKAIARHNETGLLLFPNTEAEILVDNDYIMASLGYFQTLQGCGSLLP